MIFLLTDIIVILLSFILALSFRFGGFVEVVQHQHSTLAFLLGTTILLSYFNNLYERYVYVLKVKLFFKIIKLWLSVFLVYLITAFFTKYSFLFDSRASIILYHLFLLIFLLIFKLLIVPRLLGIRYRKDTRKIPCRFIGSSKYLDSIKGFFKENSLLGFRLHNNPGDKAEDGEPREYFLYSEATDFEKLYREVKKFIVAGKPLHVASKLFNTLNLNWEWGYFEGIPIYTFRLKNNGVVRNSCRRCLDIIGALISIIILAPLFIIIALAIKLDSRGPIIYTQKRCGVDGKEFVMYKFRSMIDSRDKERDRELICRRYLEQEVNKEKLIDKKEITFVGSILRRTSLDELPQFINILKSDMSLVGPRPPLLYEVKYYKDWHRDRLLVKPGLTGLWQVYGRGTMPCDLSIFLDLIYVINRSLSLDLKMILRTIPVVILGKGAY
ncbi:MAG TPA: exopolysaccharide biosynthesis polyprenyl glycosylphosphotransferase [candidate division WOR-3 bacterium]|uniref:Exopolysaccharide biosynthesis polyprenyl glycosylphosphotransferase n=1 Tax=candidate division WOR-3 bacterium TaxID=2052148 RepID=A0A9C9EN74_UNCW3|nr:exopolysaccharide biosynthesis polyprenyl glycosylphosphotransferase [candidate division WOR-3 bacterium]